MDAKNLDITKLTQLLSLSTRSLTHLTAAMAAMAFEMMRSEDRATKAAGQRMIDHLSSIGAELDQQWQILGELPGAPLQRDSSEPLEEIDLKAAPSMCES
ncbi:MAG: hypothetical protein ABWY06_04610 [Pseudomonas sp.]|uniref:hypothetical protein n=1 Tax=Pseudomonas sp. TaxID=306 RepID=UPI00339B31A2